MSIIASQIAQNNPCNEKNYVRMPVADKREQHKAFELHCQKYNYTRTQKEIGRHMINMTGPDGLFFGTQLSLMSATGAVRKTIYSAMIAFKKNGAIEIDLSEGWQPKNIVTVLVVQHLNINRGVKITPYISYPSLSLKDHEDITNYDEYVSSVSRQKARTESSTPRIENKRVSQSRLNGNDPDAEVIRICLLYLLSESQTRYAVMRMRRRKDMDCPARFLSTMAKRLKEGTWLMTDEGEEKQKIKKMSSHEKEQLEQKLDDEAAFAAKMQLKDENITYVKFDIMADDFQKYEWMLGQYKLKHLRKLRIEHRLAQP